MRSAINSLRDHLIDPSFVRYLLAGGIVFLIYTGGTLALNAAGMPLGPAIAIAYVIAVICHFLLQRHFVFNHASGFEVSTATQIRRYVVIGVVQYAITWSATHFLPSVLGISEQLVYLATVAVLSAVFFLIMRLHVFAPADDQV